MKGLNPPRGPRLPFRPIGTVVASLALAACGDTTGPVTVQVVVSPSEATLVSIGETIDLSARATDAAGTIVQGVEFTWTSLDLSVAGVDSSGRVTARANGSAEVQAYADGVIGSALITVAQRGASLEFTTQPTDSPVGTPLPVVVEVRLVDALGTVVRTGSDEITVRLNPNPVGAELEGVTSSTVDGGVARFGGLRVDGIGSGFGLTAESSGGVVAQSSLFDVTPLSFTSVKVNFNSTCGITDWNAAYCWGMNDVGQVGDSTTVDRNRPTPVIGGLRFVELAVGGRGNCGLADGARGYCWGWRPGGGPGYSTFPRLVSDVLDFASIATKCGVTTDGNGYCWGPNSFGQTGSGLPDNYVDDPVPVTGDISFEGIVHSGNHACGVTGGGAAYCWGANRWGALGNGTNSDSPVPLEVAGDRQWRMVDAGGVGAGNHTCGVRFDGLGYCWGFNGAGELGDGTYTDRYEPTTVAGGLTFETIRAGGNHSCGLTTDGKAYCWGNNYEGRLGNGTTSQSTTTPDPVTGGLTFAMVDAGLSHSCGLATDGLLYCWGSNERGQLGTGDNENQVEPVAVWGQR